jgi:hypothetical protein
MFLDAMKEKLSLENGLLDINALNKEYQTFEASLERDCQNGKLINTADNFLNKGVELIFKNNAGEA